MKFKTYIRLGLVFLLLLIFQGGKTRAQDIPQNFAAWLGFELNLPFKEDSKWGLLLESTIKGNKFLFELQGTYYQVGVNYNLKHGSRLGAGFAYQWNIPYDAASPPYQYPDIRIYEQFIWNLPNKGGNASWRQRFYLEQRWLGRKNGPNYSGEGFDYYKFENTFRYQLRYQNWFSKRWAYALYDEIFLNTTAVFDNDHVFDQNRIYAGGVYAFNQKKEVRLELGYMFQSYWKSPETETGRSRINHVIRITLTADYPMKHKNAEQEAKN